MARVQAARWRLGRWRPAVARAVHTEEPEALQGLRCHTTLRQTAPYQSQEAEQWPKKVRSSMTPKTCQRELTWRKGLRRCNHELSGTRTPPDLSLPACRSGAEAWRPVLLS